MWVAAAAAVAAIGGAVIASDSQKSAANKAKDAANYSTDQGVNVEREMFYRGLQENQPYKEKGLSALAQYSSAVLGGPQQYSDPTYMQLSGDDLVNLNAQVASETTRVASPQNGGKAPLSGRAVVPFLTRAQPSYAGQPAAGPAYDPNKTWYRGPNGEITDKPPTLTANYDYKASPSLIPQTRAYNRALASRGLSGSGQAATGVADLANADYSTQLSRLAGLAGVGQSASNANAAAGNALGGSLANLYSNQGVANANAATAAGEAKAGLYSGMGNAALQGANLYMTNKYINSKG